MTPDYRATITKNAIVVNDWTPWLATGGPMRAFLKQRARAGVALADLTILRDEDEVATELVVDVIAGDSDLARRRILDWARTVGYRRVWLPDELVEFDAPVGGTARVRCATCRARWEDGTDDFWAHVRHLGHFPTGCPLCGDTMPQWEPHRANERTP